MASKPVKIFRVTAAVFIIIFITAIVVFYTSYDARLIVLKKHLGEEEAYNHLLQKNPNDIRALKGRAAIFAFRAIMDEKHLEIAISDFSRVLELNPDDVDALRGRTSVYWNNVLSKKGSANESPKQVFEKIIADCTRIIQLNKADDFTYNVRGLSYYELGNLSQAIADLTESIKMQPQNADLYVQRGEVYFFNDNYDLAVKDMKEAHSLRPDVYQNNPEDWFTRWTATVSRSENDKITEALSRMIKYNPNVSNFYTSRAIYHIRTGRFEKAIEDYTSVIEIEPENVDVLARRGGLGYRFIREYKKALADCNDAINMDPDASLPYYFRALIFIDMKNYDKAKKDLKKASALNTDWDEPYTKLGDLYMEIKEYRNAVTYYDKAMTKHTHVGILFLRAKALEAAGMQKEALESYKGYLNVEASPFLFGWNEDYIKYSKERIKALEKEIDSM